MASLLTKPAVPKYQRIAHDLRRRMLSRDLAAGATLPSYRTLMDEHRVTIATVRQAMQVLQAEGLVRSTPGIGSVVAGDDPAERMIGIAIVGAGDASPFMVEQLRALHDEFDRLRCHISLRFVDADDGALEKAVAWARRLDGVMLQRRVTTGVALRFAQAGVPVVLLGEPLDGPCPPEVSSVSVDVPSIMRLALGHLIGLGHRRTLFFSLSGTRYFTQLSDTFATTMVEHGLGDGALRWRPEPVPAQWSERRRIETEPAAWDAAFERLAARLNELSRPPTAIIVEEGGRASRAVEKLRERGWSVPNRVSVLGLSSSADYPNVLKELTCIVSSTREQINRGVALIDDLLRSGAATTRREMIVPRLRPGATCGALMGAPSVANQTSGCSP